MLVSIHVFYYVVFYSQKHMTISEEGQWFEPTPLQLMYCWESQFVTIKLAPDIASISSWQSLVLQKHNKDKLKNILVCVCVWKKRNNKNAQKKEKSMEHSMERDNDNRLEVDNKN